MKNLITFFITSIFFFTLFVYGIMQIMPNNPVKNLPFSTELKVNEWFPQGWGFFSKNPRDLTFNIVDISTGKSSVNWPNNSVDNLFGISRKGRSQGIEAGRIIAQINESDWRNIEGDPEEELQKMKSIVIENDSPNPTIKGDIGLYYQKPIPWSWSENKDLIMPSKIVRLTVK